MTIASDQVVTIHYKLTNNAGDVIDSSEGGEPLNYLHGHGNIVPGLEKELTGKAIGEKCDVVVSPKEGYGEHLEERIITVPRKQVAAEDLKPGMRLQADTPQGQIALKVVEVAEDEVKLDGNHELAGVTLHFAVEVVAVRPAEKGELDHGHAH